jgi:dTMP kinase
VVDPAQEPKGDDAISPLLAPPFLKTDEPDLDRLPISERVFGSRKFLNLWVAQLVSAFGDWLGFLAITILAADVGGGSGGAAVGLVMSARIIPGFFLAPWAGVMIDRWDRKRVMVTCDLVRAGVIACLPFVRNVPGLVLASLVLEVCTLLWSPAKEASVPNLVPREKLTNANSLSLAAAYGTFPIAALVFALLAQLAKTVGDLSWLSVLKTDQEALAFYVDMVTFMVSAYLISRLELDDFERRARARANAAGSDKRIDFSQTFHELKEGWRFIFANPVVRSVNLGLATGLIGGGMVVPLGSIFARDVLGAGTAGYGAFITSLGVGVAAGVLLLSVVQRHIPKPQIFELSLCMAGVCLILAATTTTLTAAIVFIFLLGVCAGSIYVVGFSLLHENTDDELRGRIFSALYTLVRLCLLIAFAVGPFMAEAANSISGRILTDHIWHLPGGREVYLPGVRITLWFAGALILLAGLVAFWSLRRAPQGSPAAVRDASAEAA